jgi:hypothetical protein
MKADRSGSIWSVAPVSATKRRHKSAGEMARRREETKSGGSTMSSPVVIEIEDESHLTDPLKKVGGETDSVETRENDGK